MNSLSTSQVAGLSLMAGAVLTFIASMFSPGGLIIDSVNGLLFLGGVWLFIIGYGIFRGRRELAPESD